MNPRFEFHVSPTPARQVYPKEPVCELAPAKLVPRTADSGLERIILNTLRLYLPSFAVQLLHVCTVRRCNPFLGAGRNRLSEPLSIPLGGRQSRT
jgi:hypothetical protein